MTPPKKKLRAKISIQQISHKPSISNPLATITPEVTLNITPPAVEKAEQTLFLMALNEQQ